MKKVLSIFLIFLTVQTNGEQKKKAEEIEIYSGIKRISMRFTEGQFLIYDCDNKRYVCVDEEGNDKCKYIRMQKKQGRFENLGCAPLKLHRNPNECFEQQRQLILRTKSTPFCDYSNFQ